MASTLMALKAQTDMRLEEEKRQLERKRNVMTLVLHHCISEGYVDTADKLQQEAGVAMSKFTAADNVDLLSIVQEFESFYEIKFGKKPKLVRRLGEGEAGLKPSNGKRNAISSEKKRAEAERRRRRNEYASDHMPECSRVQNSSVLRASADRVGAHTAAAPLIRGIETTFICT